MRHPKAGDQSAERKKMTPSTQDRQVKETNKSRLLQEDLSGAEARVQNLRPSCRFMSFHAKFENDCDLAISHWRKAFGK